MSDYDVYHLWLGISPPEQPPDHYRLLGVPQFEQNPDVIRNAADRQLSHVKRLAVNQYTQVGQKLLDEIAAAKLCLLRPEKRAIYDAQLRERNRQRAPTNVAAPVPNIRADISPFETIPTSDPARAPTASVDRTRQSTTSSSTTQSAVGLIVGSNALCDIVVDRPAVSGMHCKLIQADGKVYIKDLQSTNGTFVNNQRISGYVAVSPLDWVTLGRETRFSPPASLFPAMLPVQRVLFVGRHPACELSRDEASVSQLHARIVLSGPGMTVEDLGSTNGTSVVFDGDRITPVPPNSPTDATGCVALLFGNCRVEIGELLGM